MRPTLRLGAACAWALATLISCQPFESPLLERFPAHATSVMGSARAGWRAHSEGFATSAAPFALTLPAHPGLPAHLTLQDGLALTIEEDDATGFGAAAGPSGGTLVFRQARGYSFWSHSSSGAEEWLLAEHHGGGVLARWRVGGAALRQHGEAVDVVDAEGVPRVVVAAPAAYAEGDVPVAVSLAVRGDIIELSAPATKGRLLVDPSWTSVAPITTARYRHATALLPSGKVLIAGGLDNSNAVLGDSQVYDPATNTWTASGALLQARSQASTALLPNGKVLVAGGYTGTADLAECELYDPTTGTWSATGSLTNARRRASIVVLPNGKALITGGFSTKSANSAELYDPSTGAWSAAASMTSGRSEHFMVTLPDGNVLAAGGITTKFVILNNSEIYNVGANTWTATTGGMVDPRYIGAMSVLHTGKVLMAAGQDGLTSSDPDSLHADLYDPVAQTWSATGSLTVKRETFASTLLPDGRFVVAAGNQNGSGSVAVVTSSTELYDPVAATWSSGPSFSTARSFPSGVLLPSGKFIIIAGGGASLSTAVDIFSPASPAWSGTGALPVTRSEHTQGLLNTGSVLLAGGRDTNAQASSYLYSTSAGTFSATGSLSTARYNHTLTVLPNGNALAAGGENAGGPLSSAEVYSASGSTWTTVAPMSSPRSQHSSSLLGNGAVLLAGGRQAAGPTAQSELYQPASASFTVLPSMASARSNHTATVLRSGLVLVAGGLGAASAVLSAAELFDPSAQTWSSTAGSMSQARQDHLAVLLPNGKVLLAGGHGSSGTSLATAEVFDPSTQTFTATASMASPRERAFAALLLDGTVLVGGGFNGSTALSSTEIYDPGLGTWTAGPNLGAARASAPATMLPSGKLLVAGGRDGVGPLASAELYDEGRGAQPSWAPSVTGPLAAVSAGASSSLTGTNFRGVGEGTAGWWHGAATNFPLVLARRQDNGDSQYLNVTSWNNTTLTAAFPSSLVAGPYWLNVITSGIPGAAQPINVAAVPGAAAKLAFGVQPQSVAAGSAFSPALTVTVEDAAGNPVTSTASITLSIGNNPGASTLSGTTTVAAVNGVATFSGISLNKVGTGYTLQAASSGLTSTTSNPFNVTPGPAAQLVYAMQPSNTVAGSSIAPAVQVSVEDAQGNVVTSSTASIAVALLNNPGSSTLSGTTTVAAVNGVATLSNLSLNKVGTGYTLQATSSGLTSATSSGFNISFGTASQVAYSVQPSSTAAGSNIAPAVQVSVEDAQGNVVTSSTASITVGLLANPGSSTLSGTTTVAAVSGVASFSTLSLNKVGTGYTLQATSSGLTSVTSSAFNVTAGVATKLVYTTQPSNTVAGSSIAPAVQVLVQDAQGNVVTSSTANITVALLANPGASTLSGTATVAAVSGVATFSNLSLNKVGTGYTLQATSSGLTSVTSLGFNVTAGAATQLVYAMQPTNVSAGSSIAPAVQVSVEDAQGNVVTSSTASITVALASNPGSSTLSGTLAVAAVSGIATFSNLSLNKVGTGYTLQASSSGLTSATSLGFNVTAGTATQLVYSVQPTNVAAGSSITPAVQVSIEDAQGNVVTSSSASITVALLANPGASTLSGTTTVAAVNGVATFSNLSLNKPATGYTLQATSTGLTSVTSVSFNVTAGAAAKLVYTAQPSNTVAGASIAPAVQVSVEDAAGNVVTTSTASITVALVSNPGGSTLAGTTTVAAVNGVATFSNLSLNMAGTGYTLQASSSGLTSVTSAGFNVTAGGATQLVYTTQPSSTVAGNTIAPAVQVSVEDAQGNVVTSSTASVTVALVANPGSSTLSGTTTVAAINGVASFSNLSLNKVGTGYTLQASSTGLSSSTSVGFNVTAGSASKLAVSVQPSNTVAGAAITPAVQVSVEDAQGNVITSSTASVTVALLNNPGASTLSGTATVAAVNGVATFSNLSLNKPAAGYTLQASATGLTSVTSASFNVTAGAASQLVFSTQPSNVAAGAGIAPAVQVSVEDAAGNVVTSSTASITVALVSNPGGSTLSGTTTVAAVNGVAAFSNLSLNRAGTGYTLQAASTGLTSVTSLGFNVTGGAPTQLVYTTQPSNIVAGGNIAPAVQISVEDAQGNVVTSSTASIAVALLANPGTSTLSGTTTVAAVNGTATFSNLSLNKAGTGYTLQASATGLASATSSAFNVTAGAATQLAFSVQPSNVTAGSAVSPAVRVSIEDAQGNVVTSSTGSITVALRANPGGSTLSGTTTVAAANGIATFNNLSLNKAGTGYTLQATSSGVVPATSVAFDVTAGAGAQLVFSVQPTNVSAGSSVTPAVQVSVEDAQGNVVTSSSPSITVALLANPGSSTLSGTTTVAAVNGVASFSSLSLNKVGSGYTLQATSTGLPSSTSLGFNVTPGAPAAIAFSNLPASWTVGVPGTLTLSVVDAWGNTVPTYQGTLALAATDAQALLSGPVTFAAADLGQKLVANAATFVTPGTQRLTATDGAGLFGTSPDLNVLAAQAPAILHDANAVAAVGVPYLYNALGAVRAVGASPLSFSLCGAPSGFVLDSASGRILWTPSAAGTVSVCLQVSNAFGQDAYTFSVAVSGRAPTAVQASMSLQPPSGPAPLQVAFDGSASMGDASALPLTYRWDFADGHSVRPGVLTSNTYLVPGSYRAALSVLDVFGDSASTSAVVDVLGPQGLRPPHVLIVASATSATASLSTQLSASVTPGSSPIARYAWDLGNGTSSSTPANTVTYGPGRYHVRLTVVDTAGLASTDAVELSVLSPDGKAPPECSIDVDAPQGTVPFTSHWSAGLLSPSGAALTPSWRLSSGEALQGASFDKAYATPGVYSAHLDVVDANGLGCSDSRTLYALPASGLVPPRALTVLPPTAQCGVPYRAQGAAQGASPLAWAFGPNPPAHASVDSASGDVLWMPTRDDVGPHLFTLTASNPAGTDALSQTVTVSCPPVRALAVGCGCTSSSRTSPSALWPLLALGFLFSRRRRSQRPNRSR